MTKRDFMINYILGRAHGANQGLTGEMVAMEANEAWEKMVELSPQEFPMGVNQMPAEGFTGDSAGEILNG